MSFLRWGIVVLLLLFFSYTEESDSPSSRDVWSDVSNVVSSLFSQWGNGGGSSSGSYRPSGQSPYNRPQGQRPPYYYYNNNNNNNYNNNPYYQNNRPANGGRVNVCACPNTNRFKRDADDDAGSTGDYDEGHLNARIVGGLDAGQNEYPEMVLVLLDGKQHCGGTVLNNYYVLTAAHCVAKFSDATKFSVVPGLYDMKDVSNLNKIGVARGIYHPDYNSETYDNDVALLELEEPLNFDRVGAKPTCITTRGQSYDGLQATAVGWGRTSESGSASQVQQKVVVPIVSQADCKSWVNGRYAITDNMICAGYEEGGKDACGGDSGGPLFLPYNNQRVQVGITSFGEGCARAKRPGVYTKIDTITDFLRQNMPNLGRSCGIYSIDASSSYPSGGSYPYY